MWQVEMEEAVSKAQAALAAVSSHAEPGALPKSRERVAFLKVLRSTFDTAGEKQEFSLASVVQLNDLFCTWFLEELKVTVKAVFSTSFWHSVDPERLYGVGNGDNVTGLIEVSVGEKVAVVHSCFRSVQTVAGEIGQFALKYSANEDPSARTRGALSNFPSLAQQASSIFTAIVSSQIPLFVPDSVYIYFVIQFARHKRSCSDQSQDDLSTVNPRVSVETTLLQLREIRWTDIVDSAITKMLHLEIQKLVDQECSGEFESPMLENLKSFMDTTIQPWLKIVFQEKVPEQKDRNCVSVLKHVFNEKKQNDCLLLFDSLPS
jgi:hypothetical protein